MSTIDEALDDVAGDGCTAAAQEFQPPGAVILSRPFSLPADPFAGMRRELDALAWSLFGRLVEEAAVSEIPLDRDETSL